jgi:hypothetical protein
MLDAIADPEERDRYVRAWQILEDHHVITRDLPNGRDFLFDGPPELLCTALRELVSIEHRHEKSLLFDFVQIDRYFLLRIVGIHEEQTGIVEYFPQK